MKNFIIFGLLLIVSVVLFFEIRSRGERNKASDIGETKELKSSSPKTHSNFSDFNPTKNRKDGTDLERRFLAISDQKLGRSEREAKRVELISKMVDTIGFKETYQIIIENLRGNDRSFANGYLFTLSDEVFELASDGSLQEEDLEVAVSGMLSRGVSNLDSMQKLIEVAGEDKGIFSNKNLVQVSVQAAILNLEDLGEGQKILLDSTFLSQKGAEATLIKDTIFGNVSKIYPSIFLEQLDTFTANGVSSSILEKHVSTALSSLAGENPLAALETSKELDIGAKQHNAIFARWRVDDEADLDSWIEKNSENLSYGQKQGYVFFSGIRAAHNNEFEKAKETAKSLDSGPDQKQALKEIYKLEKRSALTSVEKDPQSFVKDFYSGNSSYAPEFLGVGFEQWMTKDPVSATQWIDENFREQNNSQLNDHVASAVARVALTQNNKETAAQWISEIENPQGRKNLLRKLESN